MDLQNQPVNSQFEASEKQTCLICQKRISVAEFPMIIEKALNRKYCLDVNNQKFLQVISSIFENKPFVYQMHRDAVI